jgi:hypothetical protein
MVARSVSVEADFEQGWRTVTRPTVPYYGSTFALSSMAEVADFVQSWSAAATQMFNRVPAADCGFDANDCRERQPVGKPLLNPSLPLALAYPLAGEGGEG